MFKSTGLGGGSTILNVLAFNGGGRSHRIMPLTHSPERAEQAQLGLAFRRLRERKRLTQADVAKELGMTSQGWQKYETGERQFSEEKIAAILSAIGATRDDLNEELNRALGRPTHGRADRSQGDLSFVIDVYGRARAGAQGIQVYDVGEPLRTVDLRQILGPSTDAMEIAGDSMVPWAEPGEIVLFDRDRYPKRGHGCVIETKAGEYYIKLYEKSDGSTLFVRELNPEERVLTFPLRDVKGVYAIRLRGD